MGHKLPHRAPVGQSEPIHWIDHRRVARCDHTCADPSRRLTPTSPVPANGLVIRPVLLRIETEQLIYPDAIDFWKQDDDCPGDDPTLLVIANEVPPVRHHASSGLLPADLR